MKYLKIIFIVVIFSGCGSEKPDNIKYPTYGRTWEIALENQLGNVSITLPKHLDSFFSWTQYGDCGDGCSFVDYRIQPKSLPVFKESGWVYHELTDSVEQFTLKHSKLNYKLAMHDTAVVKYLKFRMKSSAQKYPWEKFIIDTAIKLNNNVLVVIGYSSFDSAAKTTYQYLSASTPLKDNLLESFFEYRKAVPDSSAKDFLSNSFEYLKTLKVGNGK
jgi:hypothetical protein